MQKVRFINILSIIMVSIVASFAVTRWYCKSQYKKQVIDQTLLNIEFYRALSSTSIDKKKHQAILELFKKKQLQLLTNELGIPYNKDTSLFQVLQQLKGNRILPLNVLPVGSKNSSPENSD
jgi:hypothetical protein